MAITSCRLKMHKKASRNEQNKLVDQYGPKLLEITSVIAFEPNRSSSKLYDNTFILCADKVDGLKASVGINNGFIFIHNENQLDAIKYGIVGMWRFRPLELGK